MNIESTMYCTKGETGYQEAEICYRRTFFQRLTFRPQRKDYFVNLGGHWNVVSLLDGSGNAVLKRQANSNEIDVILRARESCLA